MVAYSEWKYFTTWALAIHATYFMSLLVVELGELSEAKHFLRCTGMPVVTGISLCVAVSVTVLLSQNWEEMYDLYCQEAQSCLDLTLEFVMAHYFPPATYLVILSLWEDAIRLPVEKATRNWLVRWNILFQSILVPTGIYSVSYDIDKSYGQGSRVIGVVLYGAVALLWSLVVELKA